MGLGHSIGWSPDQVWNATLRELSAAQAAHEKDVMNQARRSVRQAWLTAAWQRAKRMPKWESVARDFERYDAPKDPRQLLAQAHRITALMKGRQRRG